jgi:hypothetical protein
VCAKSQACFARQRFLFSYNGSVLSEKDKQWIMARFDEHTRSFREQMEKVETTLLTEFHKWASPQEMRQRSHAMAIRALDDEMEHLRSA